MTTNVAELSNRLVITDAENLLLSTAIANAQRLSDGLSKAQAAVDDAKREADSAVAALETTAAVVLRLKGIADPANWRLHNEGGRLSFVSAEPRS
jgi:hypothetical protein